MIRPLRIALASPWLVACGIPVDIGTLDGGTTAVSDSVSVSDSISDSTPSSSDGATSDSSTSVPPTETDTEDPPPPVQHDFAIRFGDLPDVGTGTDSGGSSASGTTGDLDIDPDTLLIIATTGVADCGDPFAVGDCSPSTTYGFNLPPELQFIGATGRLEDHNGVLSFNGSQDGECVGGGGTLAGNFEIVVIDGTRVAGRMFDIDAIDAPPTIDFDALRCP